MIKNHALYANKHATTKERMIPWFHKLQNDGYIDCKEFFEKEVKSVTKSQTNGSKKKKKTDESSIRYSFNTVGRYFLFDKHNELLDRVETNESTYIIFKYLNLFFPKYIQHDQQHHHQIILSSNNNQMEDELPTPDDNKNTTQNLNIYSMEQSDLINLFLKTIQSGKLSSESFFFKYLKDAFSYMNCSDKRGHRWSPDILCYGQDLLAAMGYNLYEAIGRGFVVGNSEERFNTSSDYCNLILPSSSTLDTHFHHPNVGYGDTSLDASDFKQQREKIGIDNTTLGILQVDAMDLFPSLSINRKSGLLIGALQGPIPISQSDTINENIIQNNFLAEKVIQTLYTDVEGQLRIPGNFKLCKSETSECLQELISKFEEVYTNQITCTVSDAGGANWKYFRQLSKYLHHFCYSHLCKNARNAIDTKPKFFPIKHQRRYRMEDVLGRSSIHLHPSETGQCHLVKLSFHKDDDVIINLAFNIGDSEITVSWGNKKSTVVNGAGSSFFYSVDEALQNLSLTFLCTDSQSTIPNLTISNRSIEKIFFISIEESLLQKFELKTLDEIYQTNPTHWCKIIRRSAFINYDDQSEEVLRQVCSPLLIAELAKLNQHTENKYFGLYSYLKFIHDLFHVYDDVDKLTKKSKHSLTDVKSVLTQSLEYLNWWDNIFSDINACCLNSKFFNNFSKSCSDFGNHDLK